MWNGSVGDLESRGGRINRVGLGVGSFVMLGRGGRKGGLEIF